MTKINFKSPAHKEFYETMLASAKRQDSYHRAFFYVAGISDMTRENIKRIFDFENDCIIPEGLHDGWQTSGTERISLMAFNLWNGYTEEGREDLSTPYELFDTGDMQYFFEGIKLKYPEYSRHVSVEQYMDRYER